MDVLRRLFEQHFRLPAEEARPLQGQLGGSGRAILRLTGGNRSAIGIVYSVREENVAFLEFSRPFAFSTNISHPASAPPHEA